MAYFQGIRLTRREVEVLQLAAQGHKSKAIAEQLYTSVRTVDFHKANVAEKYWGIIGTGKPVFSQVLLAFAIAGAQFDPEDGENDED